MADLRFEFDPTPPPDVNVRKFARDAWLVRGEERVVMPFVWIPPCLEGFWMGERHDAETLAKEDWKVREEPLHKVRIPCGFWMARTPTTQVQWEWVMGNNPSHKRHQGHADSPLRPVDTLKWHEATTYCRALSGVLGGNAEWYASLPTETLWEYACRAGTGMEFWSGDGAEALAEVGWYDANSGGKTRPVGGKPENDFGLHDIHGNVWECCADAFEKERYAKTAQGWSERTKPLDLEAQKGAVVLRGGSWLNHPEKCRSASRVAFASLPLPRSNSCGFRCVLFPSWFSHDSLSSSTLPPRP